MYDAFKEAMQVAQKVVRDRGIWLIRFFDLDFIDGHKDRALIESHLATNAILPVHQDRNDTPKISLKKLPAQQLPSLENFSETENSLMLFLTFSSMNISVPGTILGLASVFTIFTSGSQPLGEFVDVDPETPDNQLADAFLTKFNLVKAEFEKSLPLSACQVLDKRYFKDWTDIYVKMVESSEKEDQLAPIEFFGSMQEDEAQKYSRYMSKYWDAMVAHAEIPTKVLMYTLGEQLRSIKPAIRENYIPLAQNSTSDLDEKRFTVGALGQILDTYVKACHTCTLKAGITAADAPARLSLPDLEPPEIIKDELEPEQFRFLEFVSQVLCHTSFPWMDSTKLMRSDTLLKKLVPLYKSYRACCTLLATDVAWRIWHSLTHVLLVGVQKKDKSGRWEWLDGFAQAPEVNAEEKLDHVEGALQMKPDETESNLNLHQCNHDKLKLIIHTALSPEFGLQLGDRALPKAHELVGKLVDCPTEAFVPESPREMDILYPLDIPDPMSAEDTRHYKDKQLGSGISNLSSLPTFDNAAKDLWVAEKKAAQAEEERQCELIKQHENVKVVQSVRAERVAKVAEMRRARKIKSAPIILDSDEEGVNMEDTAPKAGPSNTTNASTASTANMSQPTMAYSWEGFKTIAKQASPDIALKELPALPYLLLMVLDLARSKPEAKSKVESIIQMGLGCQASKYVKKAQELVTAGTATGMISVKEAA
ncbi:hypothetical protein EDC04DRAFT_2602380 [Pisolithus marmoratus]|nr:hypothetical protein EDC04DRAFT_2602380 [Pisolithus marmoratus]